MSEQPLSERERWRLGLDGVVQLAVTLAGVRVVRSRLRTRPALQGTGAGTAPTSRAPAQGRSGGAVRPYKIQWLEDQPNRVRHIMAPKHGWDRLINLSGDMLQDYRAIQPTLRRVIETGVRQVKSDYIEYRAIIQGQEIVVRGYELADGTFVISNAFIQR